jgi:hypothetical protein
VSCCRTIWGDGNYDIDYETDGQTWIGIVRKDFGDAFGDPLAMTGIFGSTEQAGRELERMLGLWARQVQSGQPMTKEQRLEIFGGPDGRDRPLVERVLAKLEREEDTTKT